MAEAQTAKRRREALVIVHLADMMRVEPAEELIRLGEAEFGVTGFDAEVEAVRGGVDEAADVENRVIGLGQAVQREHAEHGAESGAEDGELESHRNESRPAIQRAG